MTRKAWLVGLVVLVLSYLGNSFGLSVVGSIDYQFTSMTQLNEGLIAPLNQAISALNLSLPPEIGTVSPFTEVQGAWAQELSVQL